ncbi:endolytic transglycosylase MltG [Pseudohongiella sp.]|uniref:Endolytic murein transglycosylase n=1 Tax=marine sediment metagenome TaxID=412755 RepID=A0A0F9W2G8_9ZZZZ|nr:endolytic transglycosylase MltG [Pseudohongiella sp.]HDZ09752.1 endolytic transglycosylase MltG [Pseudohongiella sp.]HEA61634.1 endolytic transglycosylase MltG [Pseudohongiella sp.]
MALISGRRLLIIVVLLCVSVLLLTAGSWLAMRQYLDSPLALPDEPVVVDIEPGRSLQQLANQLSAEGYLAWPRALVLWARWHGFDRRIRSGEYALTANLTPTTLMDLLMSGRVVQYPITFVEGWTVRQALTNLWQQDNITQVLADKSDEDIHAALETDLPALEGGLFPDTYFYTKGTTDLAILRRANQRLQQVLDEEWQQRAVGLPYESPWQALIMASIIERESGYQAEKQDIAGVFVRRLQTGMRLQSDPTVIYGMGSRYDGVIYRSDLNTTTAYNTYRINGLPPTPIALAGRDSIHASLQPGEGSALYFVSRGDGSHQFSDTLEEHNAAVQRYLRGGADSETN